MIPQSRVSGRAEMVRAAVLVGDVETQYRRLGSGPSLIVLCDLTTEQLLDVARRFRVIVPDSTTIAALAPTSEDHRPFAQWLAGFLEGLGVMTATILAPALLATELATVAEAHPDVIGRVVLYGDPRALRFPSEVSVSWIATAADVSAALG